MIEQFPSCPICKSQSGYEFSGSWGSYKFAKCMPCKAKWRFTPKKSKIDAMTLNELPKDGKAIYTIKNEIIEEGKKINPPLFWLFGKRGNVDFWVNLKLENKINWDYLSTKISSEISDIIFKEDEEILLYQWSGTRAINGQSAKSGILLLSNRKLRWLDNLPKRYYDDYGRLQVVHEIPLEEIKGVSGLSRNSDNWNSKTRISIVEKNGELVLYLKKAFSEVIRPLIFEAIKLRRKEIKSEKKKERIIITLDFSFLKNYMKKGGLVMQVLKCPECSGKIEFPKSGNHIQCSYCGHTIYANDIFEKVKALLE